MSNLKEEISKIHQDMRHLHTRISFGLHTCKRLEAVNSELLVSLNKMYDEGQELHDQIVSLTFEYDKEVANNLRNKYDSSVEYITEEQLKELEYELSGNDIGSDILRSLGIPSLSRMPKSEFIKSIKKICKIKEMHQEIKGK